MPKQALVHLVGSVGLENEEEVFRLLSSSLGSRSARYPDGETGERHYWIRWQKKVFSENPKLLPAGDTTCFREGTPLRYFRTASRYSPSQVEFAELGYKAAAIASYQTFARLKDQGIVPPATRFMVALPTPTAVLTSFVVPEERASVEAAYDRAIALELENIQAAIPHTQLAIQWDICHEVLAADGAFSLHYGDVIDGTCNRLKQLSSRIATDVEVGVHLCYGDPNHKHIKEPNSTATAVAFANGIAAAFSRPLNWVHLPVPRERSDSEYFEPLQHLKLPPETEVFLGLIHLTDGGQGADARIRAANRHIRKFGIAAECGFGRRDASTIPALLNLHREIADSLQGSL
jgi:methionine synthase II (cobalamin-independent)